MSSDIVNLLQNHPSLQYDNSTQKVKCSLSGHEMPYKEDAIRSYVNGKKYLKLKARDDKNYEKYKPHLVPSTKKYHKHQLFCVLTMTHVNKTPAHVERHVNGSKYKRRLKLWEECQRTGTEYRPPKGRRKVTENQDLRKGVNSVEDGGVKKDDGEVSDADSLSDLYPADVKEDDDDGDAEASGSKINNDEKDDDSDFEFEQLEEQENVNETPEAADNISAGQKRQGGKQKNKKKKKQKLS